MINQDETMFQRRLAEIQAMPDPAEQQEALRQLSMDYPGRLEALSQQQTEGANMANQQMPQGKVAGPASNPYSTYVAASPLSMAAAGAEKFMGHRDRRRAMDEASALRGQMEGQNQKLLNAGMQQQQTQAQALRQQEEERRRKMMMYGGRGQGDMQA